MEPQKVDTTENIPFVFNPDTFVQDTGVRAGVDTLEDIDAEDTSVAGEDTGQAVLDFNRPPDYVVEPLKDTLVIDSTIGLDTSYPYFPFEDASVNVSPETSFTEEPSHKEESNLFEAKEKGESPGWYTGILVMVLLMVSLARALHPRRFGETLKVVLSDRFVSQIMREEKVYSNRANILMMVAYLFSFSLFIYLVIDYFGREIPGGNVLVDLLKISAVVVGGYGAKIFALKLASFVFQTGESTNEYIFNVLTFNQFIGVALIPISIGILFFHLISSEYFIYSGFFLVGLLLILRVFRGIKIAAKNSVSIFYLFLYLCTLEILPLVVIIKVLSVN